MKRSLICLINAALFALAGAALTHAGADGFLKPDSHYQQNVVIPNPEDSELAEAFLRTGMNVFKVCPYARNCFSFKTTQTQGFEVLIYYGGENAFVGKYTFTKNPNDPTAVQTQFIKEFVPWLRNNAWPHR